MIEVRSLSHHFLGNMALNHVSFTINPGTIAALIGPNGAGKTTLMRCIATLQPLQAGQVFINGIDISEEPRQVHRVIGYLADNFGLYEDLTVRKSLSFIAQSHLVKNSDLESTIFNCASECGVLDFIDKKINTLSRGMRQRVGIAQAIIHDPRVVLLDEPASGLDPEARLSLSRLLLNLKEKGMTLIVSSHILAELEDYSTEMLVLRNGQLIEHRKLHLHENETGAKASLFKVLAENLSEEVIYLLKLSFPALSNLIKEEEIVFFNLQEEITKEHEVLSFLIQKGVIVKEFSKVKRNLQDEYLKTLKSY